MTQSSPSEVTMSEAYYDFRNTIESIRSLIEILSEEPRYIQYTPVDKVKPNNVGPDEYTRFIHPEHDIEYSDDQAEVCAVDDSMNNSDSISYIEDSIGYAL